MPTSRSYHSYLIDSLKDPLEAAAYLEAVIEEGDRDFICLALRNVVEARTILSNGSGKHPDWENLEHILSQPTLPDFPTIFQIIDELGFKLSVMPKEVAVGDDVV